MYPYIHIVLPSYAVMAFIGAFLVLILLYFRIEKYGMEFYDFIKAFIFSAFCIFIGSKVLFIITQIPNLIAEFSVQNMLDVVIHSGFVYYGGLLGLLCGIHIYVSHHSQYDHRNVFNMIAPGIPLFHAFGRIGCFMAGCCYGRELINPIVIGNFIQINSIPTQLIEVVFESILFIIILVLGKNDKRDLLKIQMVSYAIFRFLIEFCRGDEARGIWFGISTSQWISIFIIIYYVIKSVKKKCEIAEEA